MMFIFIVEISTVLCKCKNLCELLVASLFWSHLFLYFRYNSARISMHVSGEPTENTNLLKADAYPPEASDIANQAAAASSGDIYNRPPRQNVDDQQPIQNAGEQQPRQNAGDQQPRQNAGGQSNTDTSPINININSLHINGLVGNFSVGKQAILGDQTINQRTGRYTSW